VNSWFGLIPWRRATIDTELPGAWLSATRRSFSSTLQRRRRSTPVIT
jgi:hypothetical protein